ncbi:MULTISPECIES: DUF3987 domain-containing protein [unclassified Kaistella]|uniref:DUF3987 domain-containing protein n=1 Tax=unclassified Kaistella TaxID=2762626 RepID=UPI0027368A7B|nr:MULTISPECIES: DUF3987 domain-containing protein [unclassified Kaistella]MDP2452639.1 DUF3987 domain-containing protein [Kaistella sp. SH11-4b]MDP2455547.1 DUF3987 domain-containing protein [Kaistella sp. SH40-3]MDP2458451.1 DUF3987 domain-containing protein [Kaistella sp. SH19-2b]
MSAVKSLKDSIKETLNDKKSDVPLQVFPEVVQNMITEKATKQSIPTEFLFASVLGVISTSIGNTFKVELLFDMPTNASLWIAVVGESGEGKTEGINSFYKPLLKVEAENYKKYIEEVDAYKLALKIFKNLPNSERSAEDEPEPPIRKQRILQDVTVEAYADRMQKNPNGLGSINDELKGFVEGDGQYKGGKGSDRQTKLSIWNGKTSIKDRVQDSIFIEDAFLSVIGGIQIEEASEMFAKMVSDGYAPRFLMVVAENTPQGKWTLEKVDRSIDEKWEKIIRSILELENANFENNLVTFKRDAGEVLVNWRNSQEKASNFTTRLFDAKLRIYAIRLSLILHVLKRANEGQFYEGDQIDKETAENALILVDYFRNNALKMITKMKLDDPLEVLDKNKLKLYDLLPEEFTTSEGAEIAKTNELLGHTAFSTFLKNKRLFAKVTKGVYQKLITDDND